MKNDKIERSVKRAFVNAAPYQLDKVTEKCKEQKGKVIPLENKQAKKVHGTKCTMDLFILSH